jgi:hypothetical protein
MIAFIKLFLNHVVDLIVHIKPLLFVNLFPRIALAQSVPMPKTRLVPPFFKDLAVKAPANPVPMVNGFPLLALYCPPLANIWLADF